MIYYQDDALTIRDMRMEDAQSLFESERAAGYGDAENRFTGRVRDACEGKSAALVAETDGMPVGYINVYRAADHGPFAGTGVPGIEDFGVLAKYRRTGVGSKLMDAAEQIAAGQCDRVWLAVGLHHWYGPAQRMYAKRGYIPDGSGVWYGNSVCPAYAPCANDDDLNLYLVKHLG